MEDLSPQCARMATGFSGGLGDTREELCGALSGGVMVIGAVHGRSSRDEDDKPAIERAEAYRGRFLERFGHVQCRKLRDEVVNVPDGLGSCGALVAEAALLLMSVLED
jgi:C_GCAxxG_C_C family probable redox protein